MRTPPEPPPRPDIWRWRLMTEEQRMDYDGGVTAYLMALDDPQWWLALIDWRRLYIQRGDAATWR